VNELALFAGAGGGILGGHLLGWRTVCAVEFDEHARNVLVARQNDGCLEPFPIWDDVRTFRGEPWRGIVDVVSGGFPCQDISMAGGANRQGIEGERSGLWREMARIIGEVRPRFAFVENSPALTFRGLGRVLGDLAELGMDARWGVLGANHAGGFHQRARIWVVAYAKQNGWVEIPADENAGTLDQGAGPDRQKGCFQAIQPVDSGSLWMRRIEIQEPNGTVWDSIAEPRRTVVCGLGGMVDGMAGEMDRLQRIGNGQVPAVVKLAWETLTAGLGVSNSNIPICVNTDSSKTINN
jgi:DNA (cytosine-5)-methyltransferase 1